MRLFTVSLLALMLTGGVASADRDRREERRDRRDYQRPRHEERARERPQQPRHERNDRRETYQQPRNDRHDRNDHNDRRWDNRQHQQPRNDHHWDNRQPRERHVQDNRRWERPVYRNNRYYRSRYSGPVRANRRVIDRRPIYINNDRFTFHSGRTVVYRRPVIRERYYNINVRPQIIVEDYPVEPGYIWVSGSWNWVNGEWIWTGGHYAADPSIRVFYDDDSYDVYE